ncbi:MAG: hypothetical protein HQM08_27615 [Candidatus Riflebacteria bacterium]|nr:hypothetical protein [Candidatus Riflebacteria bacterium]
MDKLIAVSHIECKGVLYDAKLGFNRDHQPYVELSPHNEELKEQIKIDLKNNDTFVVSSTRYFKGKKYFVID